MRRWITLCEADSIIRTFDQKYGFESDNPATKWGSKGEQWLKEHPLTVTAWYSKNLPLNPNLLVKIPGEMGEERRLHMPQSQQIIANLAKSMRTDGYDATAPVAVRVYDFGRRIYEGNHRIRAAIAAGLDTIPVEWKWCGGSEDMELYHPTRLKE